MKQNIYLSTTFIKDQMSLKIALDQIMESKLRCVEIGSNHCFEPNYDYVTNFPYKYLVHNYFPIPEKSFVVNIASSNKEIRNKSIKHIKNSINYCEQIGADLYTFHPGFISDPKSSNTNSDNYDFEWGSDNFKKTNFENAKNNMFFSLDDIISYAKLKNVSIAIETEGSFNKKEVLLMQRPEEYSNFINRYDNSDICINLNIGHLNLASHAFDFSPYEFVDLIENYIVAMELSHNNGFEDQHLPLEKNGWYWDIILDSRFDTAYKILEFRNTPINKILDNINFF